MSSEENIDKYKSRIRELEQLLSELKFELKETKSRFAEELEKQKFYQLIADFTFGWELWLDPAGEIKYCSPSCFDLTGYTSNQIIAAESITELLIYQTDRDKYAEFLVQSLDQMLVNQSLEFRILTRTKQLRWCIINVRGVYDKQGKYLGIRASIQDITRLKRAMGQIQEMEAVKELEDRTRQRLQNQLSVKDRELVSFLLQLSQKNELLSKVTNQLKTLKYGINDKTQKQFQQLLELLEVNVNIPLDWPMVESQLEKIHPGFFNRLQFKHPIISVKDKKLCAFLRLGLSSKEISGLQNITSKSVEIARIRLKKKLKLPEKTRLANYLIQL
ncbi:MAG TPA: PAS domain-containing protein [Draconibacterium sp.]|nr:PAS domain-containing protein [Draconibacterium sp.]